MQYVFLRKVCTEVEKASTCQRFTGFADYRPAGCQLPYGFLPDALRCKIVDDRAAPVEKAHWRADDSGDNLAPGSTAAEPGAAQIESRK
jgi:hypothetical protein